MDAAIVIDGAVGGAVAVFAAVACAIALLAVESWRFDPSRGAWGGLAQRARGWLHSTRDHDVAAAVIAALLAIAPACIVVAVVATRIGADEGPALADVTRLCGLVLAASAGAPVVAGLAGAPGTAHRLAFDAALTDTARTLCVVGTVIAVAGTPLFAPLSFVGLVVLASLVSQPPHGFQPPAVAGASDGVKLAVEGGARLTLVAIAALIALRAPTALDVDGGAAVAIVGVGAVACLGAAIAVVTALGPRRAVGRGLRGPIVLLIAGLVVGLAHTTLSALL